ncbi:unnamed protein product [Prunus armeniaca]
MVGSLHTKRRYMQTSEGNWRMGKLANHISKYVGEVAGFGYPGQPLVYSTQVHAKKRETVQPLVQTNRAGDWGNIG